jgi:pyruvate dehydrogenase E1 component alpha subunit
MLEAVCFRFRGHYEGDHDTYRPRDERKRMLADNDPLRLAENRLVELGLATEQEMQRWREESAARASAMLAQVRLDPFPPASDLHRFSFAGI